LQVAVTNTPEMLTYAVPERLRDMIVPGVRVRVPIRRRTVVGMAVAFTQTIPQSVALKDVHSVLDVVPLLPPDLLRLGTEIARGYVCSPSAALEALIPGGFKIKAPACLFLTASPAQAPQLLLDGLTTATSTLYQQIAREGRITVPEMESTADYTPYATLIDSGLVELIPFCDPPLNALAGLQLFTVEGQTIKDFTPLPPEGQSTEELQEEGISRDRLSRYLAQGKLWARPVLRTCETRHHRTVRTLTPDQEQALEAARTSSKPMLLHGITSSGKTEVYLRLAEEMLAQGKTVIVLVPELALTPQTMDRFRERLGDCIAQLHSGLTAAAKADQWRSLRRGEARVAVGARSAIFAPLDNLGLIVVDEEHDQSYKQDENPRYQAISVAQARTHIAKARLIMGSATPSLESIHSAMAGRFARADLPTRIDARPMPRMELVDLREAPVTDGAPLSSALISELEQEIASGGQAMLLLNRRGLHRYALCEHCGVTITCPHCDISLVHHRGDRLICHYCGYHIPMPSKCPICSSEKLILKGYGTQMAEEVLRELFPHFELGRLDTDVTAKRGELERVLKRFSRGELRILLGTQMIAKGHDFPTVGLVGIMDADSSLSLPDFRSAERTYALITQMSGRAGRGVRAGRVIIQSYHPAHYAVQAAANYHRQEFYDTELEIRRRFKFPPFVRLAQLLVEGTDEKRVEETMDEIARWLGERVPDLRGGELVGPAIPMISRIQGKHRRHLLLKGKEVRQVSELAGELRLHWHKGIHHRSGLRLIIDVDPRNMF
jgi:primosomal protein N' (replication factor Y) (superfamily II helicase)